MEAKQQISNAPKVLLKRPVSVKLGGKAITNFKFRQVFGKKMPRVLSEN